MKWSLIGMRHHSAVCGVWKEYITGGGRHSPDATGGSGGTAAGIPGPASVTGPGGGARGLPPAPAAATGVGKENDTCGGTISVKGVGTENVTGVVSPSLSLSDSVRHE